MTLTNLKDYVEKKKQWYIDEYSELDWQWYDEDLVYLKELNFVPEYFIRED